MARVYLTEKPAWNAALGRNEITVDEVTYPVLLDTEHELGGCSGLWIANQGAGTTVVDSAGSNDMECINGADWSSDGVILSNSLNRYLQSQAAPMADIGANDFTIVVKGIFGGTGNYEGAAIGTRSLANNTTYIVLSSLSNNNIYALIADGAKNANTNTGALGLTAFHLTVVRRSGVLELWRDGTTKTQADISAVGSISTNEPFRTRNGGYGCFTGTMQIVGYWTTALSALQVASLNTNPYQAFYYEAGTAPATTFISIPRPTIIDGSPFGGTIL